MDFSQFGDLAYAAEAVAHGVVGGIANQIQGGDFLSGFAAAGFAQFVGGSRYINALGPLSQGVVRTVVGGVSSVLGGGKFKNGAVTAAFGYLFGKLAPQHAETTESNFDEISAQLEAEGAFSVGPYTLAVNDCGIGPGTICGGSSIGGDGGAALGGSLGSRTAAPVGRIRSPLSITPGTNTPTTIEGRYYTGHALDRMQQYGYTPSVIENTLRFGQQYPGITSGTIRFGDCKRFGTESRLVPWVSKALRS